ncbi:hypothetical protein [Halorubrum laminariae]|nr:hypothetical protein [Halorubrum laminariae]
MMTQIGSGRAVSDIGLTPACGDANRLIPEPGAVTDISREEA